ncbi:MAG: radical SAM protein [Tissierellia bacterium]|nr:radical SAM protein [Tissierellia bacterium]
MKKTNIIPIFVPHLGCPQDCVFCNQRRITGQIESKSSLEITNYIEKYLSYFKNKEIEKEIAFYGGSFTAIDQKYRKELLEIAKSYKDKNIIQSIRISTRPDYINEEILSQLCDYGVDIIELGIQSMDDNVLRLSNRGHSAKDSKIAVNLIRENKYFSLGLQQMIGLPGENYESMLFTTREIIDMKPDFVRIYPTLVIKDTELHDQFLTDTYKPLSLEDAVNRTSKLIAFYYAKNIDIIRIGLQNTDEIARDKDVLAGPFHESFRELAEGRFLRDIILNFYNRLNLNFENLEVLASNRNISLISGHKGMNKKYLYEHLKLKKIKLRSIPCSENLIFISDFINKYKILIDKEAKNIIELDES